MTQLWKPLILASDFREVNSYPASPALLGSHRLSIGWMLPPLHFHVISHSWASPTGSRSFSRRGPTLPGQDPWELLESAWAPALPALASLPLPISRVSLGAIRPHIQSLDFVEGSVLAAGKGQTHSLPPPAGLSFPSLPSSDYLSPFSPHWAAPCRPTRPALAQLQDPRKCPGSATQTSLV